MMNQYEKYNLNFDRTVGYFLKKLKWGNTLSKIIMKDMDLRSGSFFTLISEGSHIQNIYQFSTGGLHSDNNLLSQYISNELDSNHKLKCVFEDVQYAKEDLPLDIFKLTGHSFKNELYYVVDNLNKNNMMNYASGISSTYLKATIAHSVNFWRELSLTSEFHLDSGLNEEITYKTLEKIVEGIKVLILSSYDGEGYLFWERIKFG